MLNLKEDIDQALQTLQSGGLILYPTDTIWGIGCDATNEAAVEKVFALKGRASNKSLIILLEAEHKLNGYVREIPDVAYQLMEFAERPMTIIYHSAKNLAPNVPNEDGSIGIRIVKHPFCERLLQRFRKPIVSTSANLSGEPSPANFGSVSAAIREGVDYVVNYGQDDELPHNASTIIKLGPSGQYKLIRK